MTRSKLRGKKKQAAQEVIVYKERGKSQDMVATPEGLYDRAREEALSIICDNGLFVFIPLLHQDMPQIYRTCVKCYSGNIIVGDMWTTVKMKYLLSIAANELRARRAKDPSIQTTPEDLIRQAHRFWRTEEKRKKEDSEISSPTGPPVDGGSTSASPHSSCSMWSDDTSQCVNPGPDTVDTCPPIRPVDEIVMPLVNSGPSVRAVDEFFPPLNDESGPPVGPVDETLKPLINESVNTGILVRPVDETLKPLINESVNTGIPVGPVDETSRPLINESVNTDFPVRPAWNVDSSPVLGYIEKGAVSIDEWTTSDLLQRLMLAHGVMDGRMNNVSGLLEEARKELRTSVSQGMATVRVLRHRFDRGKALLKQELSELKKDLKAAHKSISKVAELSIRASMVNFFEQQFPELKVEHPVTSQRVPYTPVTSLENLAKKCRKLKFWGGTRSIPEEAKIDLKMATLSGKDGSKTKSSRVFLVEVSRSNKLCPKRFLYPKKPMCTRSTKLLYKLIQVERGITALRGINQEVVGAAVAAIDFEKVPVEDLKQLKADIVRATSQVLPGVARLHEDGRLYFLPF